MDPRDDLETPVRRAGRVRAAWQALLGAPVVPSQIRAEWVAWQFEFETLCDKLTTTAARLYQRDKRALDAAEKRILELETQHPCGCEDGDLSPVAGSGWNPQKRALNRSVLAGRGVHLGDERNGNVGIDSSE